MPHLKEPINERVKKYGLEWIKQKTTVLYQKFRKLVSTTFTMPDGKKGTFEILAEPDTVAVFALDQNNEVILTPQFRPGPNTVLCELPSGIIRKDQTPEEAAFAELKEETGYTTDLQYLIKLGTHFPEAYSQRKHHSFMAVNCRQTGFQHLGTREFIEVTTMPLETFKEGILMKGMLTEPHTAWLGIERMQESPQVALDRFATGLQD